MIKLKIRGNPLFRKFDASIGRALIFLLRIFKRQRSFPRNIESIGVLKLAAIGDLVLLAGVLHDIRSQYPKARIILFCGQDNQALSAMLSSPHEVVVLSAKDPLFSIRQLRKIAPTLLLDFGQWSRLEALFSFFSKSRYRISNTGPASAFPL